MAYVALSSLKRNETGHSSEWPFLFHPPLAPLDADVGYSLFMARSLGS